MHPTSSLSEVIKNLIGMYEAKPENYEEILKAIALIFPSYLKPQFEQLVCGPVHPDHLSNKKHAEQLVEMGIGIYVCLNREPNAIGARNSTFALLRELEVMEELRHAQ